jgi:HPt (histidine-containing phosphotransfer) domain-containing protein
MNEALIDVATFRALQEAAGKEFVAELIETFLQEAPGMLVDLRDARAKSDADRFRRAAHSLKSNCNTFGALALGAMARELEMKGIPDSSRNEAALDALEAAYAPVAAALKELGRA